MRVLESGDSSGGAASGLRLRPLAESDLAMIRDWRNQDEVRHWFRTTEPIGEEQHAAWWRAYCERADDCMFVIEALDRRGGARAVGTVSLYAIDPRGRSAEFGRLVIGEPDARGRGLAAGATRLLVDWAFAELALDRLQLEVRVDNARAIAMYERSGFAPEGSAEGWLTMSCRAAGR